MAERRMFAKTIIDSDAFLDMPLSAHALYFHLSMRADDDGFINNPKKIQRMIGASDDDMKLLIMKRFIILFESGIIVIKHWKIHNYIRNDRYKPTIYQEEKAQLEEKDNKSYTENLTGLPSGIPNGYQMDPQVRDRTELGQDRVRDRVDCQQIKDLYNEICISFPRLTVLSVNRKKAIRARLNTYSVDDFKTVFEAAENSSFLKGKNDRNWTATFDWMMKDANFVKILEGNYANAAVRKSDRRNPKSKAQGDPFLNDLKDLWMEADENE